MLKIENGQHSVRIGAARPSIRTFLSQNYAAILFVAVFLIPTTASIIINGIIASDRYISETKFIVRGLTNNSAGGLGILLKTFGLSRNNDDSFAIQSYIASRDALRELQQAIDVKGIYQRQEADILTRYYAFGTVDSFELFFKYFENQINIEEDLSSGIVTLSVSAYRPNDAKAIADHLLQFSEAMVNKMNVRARRDTMRLAYETLQSAEARLIQSHNVLTRFRNAESIVDPNLVASGNMEVIAGLSQELADREVDLNLTQRTTRNNPNLFELEKRVDTLKAQLKLEKGKVAGSDEALSNKLGRYEELMLRRAIAEKEYEGASTSLEQARQEASRKQVYLETVVEPNLPDRPQEPKRMRYIFTTALLSFSSFIMIYLLVSGSREHLNVH